MNAKLMDSAHLPDEELWRMACIGDRDAFTKIVERYQALICSIAYSSCGALGTSEDMAQETFINAWHRLHDLREPTRLRQWLCGIVRNLAANSVRREFRRGGPQDSLEWVTDAVSADEDPAAQAVSREEEALLWRTLVKLPENYREPLVLFYREGKSVTEVARKLDLTEETTRQRLSRGRTMLRDEIAILAESALSRSRPGAAFTAGVLVALPMLSSSTTSAALAAKAAAEAKAGAGTAGALAKISLGMLVGPLLGVLFSCLGMKAAEASARSERERRCIRWYASWIIGFCFGMSIGLVFVLNQAGKLYTPSALGLVLGVLAWTALLTGGTLLLSQRLDREVRRIRTETPARK